MSNLAVKLPHYDGSFDALFALIRRHQYSVAAVPVAEIVRQFADYLGRAEALDIEIGAEFVETAAWLIYLKSLSLLPQPAQESEANEKENPPLSGEALQSAIEFLRKQLQMVGCHPEQNLSDCIVASGQGQSAAANNGPPTVQHVMAAARHALETAQAHKDLQLAEPDPFTVEDRLAWIHQKVAEAGSAETISTSGWFAEQPSDGARTALFLALLELPRKGPFRLWQGREFGEIYLRAA